MQVRPDCHGKPVAMVGVQRGRAWTLERTCLTYPTIPASRAGFDELSRTATLMTTARMPMNVMRDGGVDCEHAKCSRIVHEPWLVRSAPDTLWNISIRGLIASAQKRASPRRSRRKVRKATWKRPWHSTVVKEYGATELVEPGGSIAILLAFHTSPVDQGQVP